MPLQCCSKQSGVWKNSTVALACAIVLAALNGLTVAAQDIEAKPLYLDPTQPIETRVDDLMMRMTLKEKIGQLNLPCAYVDELGKTPQEKMEAGRKFAAGTYTTEIGPGSGFFTFINTLEQKDLAANVNYLNELQKIALTQTRLHIPLLEDEERCFREQRCFPKAWPSAARLTCRW
jgi:beta-glucosidase